MLYTLEVYEKKLPVKRLITDFQDRDRFMEYCKACRNYQSRWSCPSLPFETNEYLINYRNAHLITAKIVFKKVVIDGADTQEMINKITEESIQKVREQLGEKLRSLEKKYPSSVSIVSGGCNICKICTRTLNKPCVHPEKMRYSLNTFGFDITKLLNDLFQIELVWSKGRLPAYYTLVSAFLTNETISSDLLVNELIDLPV